MVARSYAKAAGLPVEIPIAAEYVTDVGDIIVVGVPESFEKVLEHGRLCRRVHEFGGHTMLPHPYHGHALDALDFTVIDAIEVFNSRRPLSDNRKAVDLALREGKWMVYGADAHRARDMLNAMSIFDGPSPFVCPSYPIRLRETATRYIALSQIVKGLKRRDFRLTMGSLLGYMRWSFRDALARDL